MIDANVTGGDWRVDLAPMPAGGPYTLTVQGDSTVAYTNVMVGDIWFCSGQSNMNWPLKWTDNGPAAQATAGNYELRFYNRSDPWVTCNSTTAGDFSAVGFYFGREMNIDQNVPIGLIEKATDGTSVTLWSVGGTQYK